MAKRLGSKKVKRSLNSSLDFLIPSKIDEEVSKNPQKAIKELSQKFAMIPLKEIEANPDQPRKEFAEEALKELSDSIKVHGLIQPITVRRLAPGQYQIISGERRWRASKIAELEEVPAYIRIANDQELMEMALIENIQRENLNPFEIAVSYYRLKSEFDLTDEQLANRVGKGRSTLTNYLNLLNMYPPVIEALKADQISMGHAKAIKGIKDSVLQRELLNMILDKQLSVRETEQLARTYSQKKKKATPSKTSNGEEYKELLQHFKDFFGNGRIRIQVEGEHKGQIVIPFKTKEELHHFFKCVEQG
ncbi:MAG: ParB/RepB/Spo0J family partition protein [Bacteroidota bacterium]